MKKLFFVFLTSTLLFLSISHSTNANNEKRIIKTNTVKVEQIIMTIQYGDGFFTLTRRLFTAIGLDPTSVTWNHVLLLKTIYEEQKGYETLTVGEKFVILKSDFI
ncbi:hypothetical protein [Flammeovirga sp. SubArs3]|uniref:hypothetical protein n=1 Tax=Flammeovirga sp. SubArs3 TaxID=2995316 RepID=UPI00248C2D91|nr:hypothetical protein [Flammeovirga sp. SubArs3]